jgi:hypothetical protein
MRYIAIVLCLFACCATTTPCPTGSSLPCPAPATCATACAQGDALGCAWAAPTPMGATCQAVCDNAAQTVTWDVKALTSATSCGPLGQ